MLVKIRRLLRLTGAHAENVQEKLADNIGVQEARQVYNVGKIQGAVKSDLNEKLDHKWEKQIQLKNNEYLDLFSLANLSDKKNCKNYEC